MGDAAPRVLPALRPQEAGDRDAHVRRVRVVGVPWGIVLTPIQIARNLLGLARREPRTATEQFEQVVRRKLAAHRLRGLLATSRRRVSDRA